MIESAHAEMITLARESRGESQGWLSEQTGISPPRLSRMESGLVVAKDEEVVRIAAALHYPIGFFYRSGGLFAPATDVFHHRKRQSLLSTHRRQIHANLRLRRLELRTLTSDVEIGSREGFKPMDLDDYDGDVERLANAVRASWGIAPGPILDLTAMIELSGGIVYSYQFGTPKVDAVSQFCDQLPLALFFVNADAPGDRTRWNLAHEMGHLFMHDGLSPNAEQEANRFAAAFLMPAADIRAELSPSFSFGDLMELKLRWKVSMSALVRRAMDLGVIDEAQAKNVYVKMSKRGWMKVEPMRFAAEKPRLLGSILKLQREEHGYGVEALAQRLCLMPNEFVHLYYPDEVRLRIVD